MNIRLSVIDEDGNDVTFTFPARFIVCPECEGHGKHLPDSMRHHAYSAEEWAEMEPNTYDITCHKCHGNKVVQTIDRGAITESEDRELLTEYETLEKTAAKRKRRERAEERYAR